MIAPAAPNIIDRLVGFFSPVAGVKRLRARAGLRYLSGGAGGYDAGRSDKKSLERYNPTSRSAATAILPGLERMRARSRDQVRNNPIATGAINTSVTSTVGSGLTCQPNIDQELLGLTDEQADAWEADALRWWTLWADTTECDIESELVFGQMQELAYRSVLESGDILRLRRFLWDKELLRPRRGDAFATKLQLVEADRVSNPKYVPDTNVLQGGVEVDGDGRVSRYWVQTAHPGDSFYYGAIDDWRPVPTRHPKSGQRIARLMFYKQRPGQRRGVPYLAPVIAALKQLERYTDAELMAAVVSAMFTVFVTSETPDASPLSGLTGVDDPDTESDLHLGNALVVDLAPGEDVSTANPGRPNAKFDPFVRAILEQVGVALELPFEVLVKHFSSSYSASRGALLEAWKFFRARRRWLVRELCQPCYEDVISEAVARGLLDAPGFFDDPLTRRAWLGTTWTGDAMPQIDPLKEANASKTRIAEGLSTIDREARETNGTTFLENHTQLRKEARMRVEDGLNVEVVAESFVTLNTDDDEELEGELGDREDTKALMAGVSP